MEKIEYFVFDEVDGSTLKYEAGLLEFCLESLVIFGYFSSKLAVILPFKFVQEALLSGGKMKGILLKSIDYWTPYFLSEERFNELVGELQSPELKNKPELRNNTNIHIPNKIVWDEDLNADFINMEDWKKRFGRKYTTPSELRQFSLAYTYNIYFNRTVVGNFVCHETRNKSKFKGAIIPNGKFPHHMFKSVKHTVGERLEPIELNRFRIEDNYNIFRRLKFMYLIKSRVYFQTLFP